MIHNRRFRHSSTPPPSFWTVAAVCLVVAVQPGTTDGFQHSSGEGGRRQTKVPSVERRRRILPSAFPYPVPQPSSSSLLFSILNNDSIERRKRFPTTTTTTSLHANTIPTSSSDPTSPQPPQTYTINNPPNVDEMIANAGKLRRSIRAQQLELQKLETHIVCCTSPSTNSTDGTEDGIFALTINRSLRTLLSSTSVLLRKLQRVRSQSGPNNQRYEGSISDYIYNELGAIPRIVEGLVRNPKQIRYLVDPSTPTLIPHVPAILSRLNRLEDHVPPILERVLNNSRHLASIEPYLSEILERFDDIEPHLAWILDNIDALAPYTGLLLRHIDELLLYADADEGVTEEDGEKDRYALAAQLLPYLEYYVSRLDVIGPHLPLLRPHVPLLLRHDRIQKISPHIERLFARGYRDLSSSANMDVLLWWFGWTLRIPYVPQLFFALPGSPRIVSFLANRMPRRCVRRGCVGVQCSVEGGYGDKWNKLD